VRRQLFGEDEDAAASQAELDAALQAGEDAQEISKLRQEQQAFVAVRGALRSDPSFAISGSEASDAARNAFEKVFDADVRNLLGMADMWRTRAPPVPLVYDAIRNDTFVLPSRAPVTPAAGPKGSSKTEAALANGNGQKTPSNASEAAKLRDQRVLSLKETVGLFVSAYVLFRLLFILKQISWCWTYSTDRLAARLRAGEPTIAFDKDDPDALDFVTAAANLRAFAYGIHLKSRWEVKGAVLFLMNVCASFDVHDCIEMAGNIIPAIATTNAIIAGLSVLQALHLLRRQHAGDTSLGKLRNVHAQFKPVQPLAAILPSKPNLDCGVCRDTFVTLRCDPSRATLGEVVRAALGDGDEDGAGGTGEREVSVFEGARMLAEPDWDDNLVRPLDDMGVGRGTFLTIVDDEGDWGALALAIAGLPYVTFPPLLLAVL
jgi:ubiquitin-like 1-activating enzyme E1 B